MYVLNTKSTNTPYQIASGRILYARLHRNQYYYQYRLGTYFENWNTSEYVGSGIRSTYTYCNYLTVITEALEEEYKCRINMVSLKTITITKGELISVVKGFYTKKAPFMEVPFSTP